MAGEENLIPLNKRTKEEQREIASKGGKASGEARRRRKSLKDSMNLLLDMPISSKRDFNKTMKMGYDPEDTDNSIVLMIALFEKAKSGDVSAIKEIRNIIGEDGVETQGAEVTIIDDL